MAPRRARQPRAAQDTPLLEWVLGLIGLAILIAAVVFLLLRGSEAETHGDVALAVDRVLKLQRGHLVRFSASNEGSESLADVHVSAKLLAGDRVMEEAEMTFDYLPGRSIRRGGFYFQSDPEAHRIELVVHGFQDP